MVQVCPKLESQGVCGDSSCRYRHDIHICEDCGVICSSSNYQAHLVSKRHKRQVSGANTFLRCSVCNVNILGPREWTKHISGSRHIKKVARHGASTAIDPEEAASTTRSEYCNLCRQFVPRVKWTQHAQSPVHRKREKFATFQAIFQEAQKNKHGVIVSDGFDFGIISSANAQKGVGVQISVETTVPASRIRIIETKFSSATNLSFT